MKKILPGFYLLLLFVFVLNECLSQNFEVNDLRAGNVYLLSSFPQGMARITDDHKAELDKLVKGFKAYESMEIEVIGHTDFAGNQKMNLKLSKDRSEAVRKYLISQGVKKKRIKVSYFGGEYPLSRERSPEAIKMNRRTEIVITKNYELGVNFHKKEFLSYANATIESNQDSVQLNETGKRVALLIGNSKYDHSQNLKNPNNDVKLMQQTLESLGFETYTKTNLDRNSMSKEIQEFARKLSSSDIVFFYYAGHGMQYNGHNYLLPTDAKLENGALDLPFESISVEVIFKILEYTNRESLNIIVLDACRNNNFPSTTRGGDVGLTALAPPSGTVIGYATSPGSVAFDGNGDNGIYTQELATQLSKSQRIEDVFMHTRNRVEELTDMAQSPWELFRLRKAYSLK